ncbi:MAG: hypothetical protein WBM37_09240 [Nitrososphaeraceae archaeon]
MSATATGVNVAENTTTYEFPKSKRKIVKDSKDNVMTVTAAKVTVRTTATDSASDSDSVNLYAERELFYTDKEFLKCHSEIR